MSIEKIVAEIDAEITRLEQAKQLLSDVSDDKRRPGRPRKGAAASAAPVKKRRKMSAAARAKIAAAQKARWAKTKKAGKSPGVAKPQTAK
ncbi:MAG: hypothetical protein ABSG84_19110 [Acidobacteriaceae bacterium]